MLKKIWRKFCAAVSTIASIWEAIMYIFGVAEIFGPVAVLMVAIMFVYAPLVILRLLYEWSIWLYDWLCSLF